MLLNFKSIKHSEVYLKIQDFDDTRLDNSKNVL